MFVMTLLDFLNRFPEDADFKVREMHSEDCHSLTSFVFMRKQQVREMDSEDWVLKFGK